MGASVAASVAVIATMNAEMARLAAELEVGFDQHPDAQVVRSLPGLGTVLGARVLGEFGDEPDRYVNAKSRKNYAGTSPITRASGSKKVVLARHVRNRRLADAIYLWAFAALIPSAGARAFYDQHRAAGDTHHAALRALGNRLVGILHGCLAHGALYDEVTAWGHRQPRNLPKPLDKLGAVGCLEEVLCHLERLREHRVFETAGVDFRFRYEILGEVLRQGLSPARRRFLTERAELARAVLGQPQPKGFDAIEHPIYLLDPVHNRIVEANRAGCDLVGYDHDELVGTRISATHPAELAQLVDWVTQVRTEEVGWSALFNCRTKTGNHIPVEMMALAPDPNGLVVIFTKDRSAHHGPAA